MKDNASGDRSVVLADRVQLQQVLVNLIMNAIDAMGSLNEQERLLTLDFNNNGEETFITVTDTGTGIEPGDLGPCIGTLLHHCKVEGMGLGLSICRSIAEAHGGRLWCRRTKLEAPSFIYRCPYRRRDRGTEVRVGVILI